MIIIGLLYLALEDFFLSDFSWASRKDSAKPGVAIGRVVVGAQIGLTLLAIIVTRSSALSLQAKQGLPIGNQVVGWIVLGEWIEGPMCKWQTAYNSTVISFLMPIGYKLDTTTHYMHRLMVIFLTCAPTFVILTISYEGLFYVTFSLTLLAWVKLEYSIQQFTAHKAGANGHVKDGSPAEPRPLKLSDARVVLFFMVLLQSAFFSTGNIASISSFSLESVNRLIPIFDPFSQGALLILKIMIPFGLLSASLGVLNMRLGVAPSALFMLSMGLSDILTLYFFWVVKDEGSWLEIGSTITHFAIASFMCVFVAALEGVSSLFISGISVDGRPAKVGENGDGMKVAPNQANGKGSLRTKKS